MPGFTRARTLVVAFILIMPMCCWGKDKGHPANDVVAKTPSTTCKDDQSGQAGLKKSLLADESKLTLRSSWVWIESGFDDVLPEIDLDPDRAYLFHVTTWKVSGSDVTMESSSWYVYHTDGLKMTQSYRTEATEDVPFLYGDDPITLISVQRLDPVGGAVPEKTIKTSYKLTVKEKAAQNVANLVAVAGALVGVKIDTQNFSLNTEGLASQLGIATDRIPVCVESFEIDGGHPPYDLTAEASFEFSDKASTKPSGSGGSSPKESKKPKDSSDSKDSGNSISRTVNILDKEYWDINLGLNIPSVKGASFSLSKDNTVQQSITKLVSPYAFISIYPFAAISPKDGSLPHINLGLPVANQPLHQPFGGIAEKIPWIDRYTGIPISVFGGVVALKQSVVLNLPIGTTTTADAFNANLHSNWVWKGMFGLEFPVSSLISKIGKK